jgi:hypothetical protein
VEVDSLIECAAQNEAGVERWLTQLYERGVRHLFPIHLADNAIGGAALYHEVFDVVNRWLRGRPFDLADHPYVEFQIGQGLLLRALAGRRVWARPPEHGFGHVNRRGLTEFGRRIVIPAMMRLGFIIDVDHMSAACLDDVLTVAEAHDYPLMAGYTAFHELAFTRAETGNVHPACQ